MPSVAVYDMNRRKVGEIDLPESLFGAESRPHLYHAVIRAQLLSKRAGTVKTKKRDEVRGATHKVFRQKGTGRARQGDSRSPMFRRGGVVFGPQPRDWDVKILRKVKRSALLSAISDRLREGHLIVLDGVTLEKPRTKRIAEFLSTFELGSALFVDGVNESLSLSCRNLPEAKYLSVRGLNLFDVLKYDHLVITKNAVDAMQQGAQ